MMADPLVVTGLFSLGGVALGALLTPLTQLYLEKKREQRASDRAKVLVTAELLHAQMTLRAFSELKLWPSVEDGKAFFPTSAWQENRSTLAGKMDEDLWKQLVLAYALLETDRIRFVQMSRLPPDTPLPEKIAEGIKQTSNNLGRLRRRLGGGVAWLDEIYDDFKPRMDILNKDFKLWLDGLSDDDLKEGDVIAKVKERAKELGEMNRALGDSGAWSAEIDHEIKRRLK